MTRCLPPVLPAAGLFLCTVLLLLLRNAYGADLSMIKHDPPGIITFHTPQARAGRYAGLDDPTVAGSELITWWTDLEPEEGKYDWGSIERSLNSWTSAGKKMDLRVASAHHG